MRAMVVYESMFGNTGTIARAVADGLSTRMEVTVHDVASAPTAVPPDIALVVAGGPTHAFGLSGPGTRQSAEQQAGTTATPVDTGLREWLDALAPPPSGTSAAAFDTRVKVRGLPGSAARRAGKRLRRLGFARACPPESFWVSGTPGPLVDGEEARARQWGEALARTLDRSPVG